MTFKSKVFRGLAESDDMFVSSYDHKAFTNCSQYSLRNKVTPMLPEADAERCADRVFAVGVPVTAAGTHLEIGIVDNDWPGWQQGNVDLEQRLDVLTEDELEDLTSIVYRTAFDNNLPLDSRPPKGRSHGHDFVFGKLC